MNESEAIDENVANQDIFQLAGIDKSGNPLSTNVPLFKSNTMVNSLKQANKPSIINGVSSYNSGHSATETVMTKAGVEEKNPSLELVNTISTRIKEESEDLQIEKKLEYDLYKDCIKSDCHSLAVKFNDPFFNSAPDEYIREIALEQYPYLIEHKGQGNIATVVRRSQRLYLETQNYKHSQTFQGKIESLFSSFTPLVESALDSPIQAFFLFATIGLVIFGVSKLRFLKSKLKN